MWSSLSQTYLLDCEQVQMWKATDAGEAEWKESSGRLGPVGDVSVEYSDANNEGYDDQVDHCEHHVDGRRYLMYVIKIIILH